ASPIGVPAVTSRTVHRSKTFVQDRILKRKSETYDRPMGNREKLLEGAMQCLLDKGYAGTTARDIAKAAGVSLAAINYHFRTTEALLDEALRLAIDRWGEELERALTGGPDVADPQERFVAVWDRVIASVAANRSLWTTQFELVTRFGHQAAPESPWA